MKRILAFAWLSLFCLCANGFAAPANDHFSSATRLSGIPGSITGSTAGASSERDEPGANLQTRSIWYSWVAEQTAPVAFDTEGSDFDTVLAVFTGADLATLNEIDRNDDAEGDGRLTSRIELLAQAGTVYYISVDGYKGETGSVRLAWSYNRASNDSFSSPATLTGWFGQARANNTLATSEANEPDPGPSLWYRWTAPTNGNVVFNTAGSSFDTVLCVYTGDSLTSLLSVICDDNGNNDQTSRASFAAEKGVEYRISIRGSAGQTGQIALSWGYPGFAKLQLLPDLSVWADEEYGYLHGWYIDTTEQPGRILLRLSTATPNSGAGPLELHGSSTEPGVHQRIYNADGTFTDRLAGTFTFHPTHDHLHFDNYMQFQLRAVTANDGVGEVVRQGHKTSFAIIDLTEYDLTLPGASPQPRYSDGLLQGLSVGWCDVYSASLPDQWIDVSGVPAGRYWLEATVDPEDRVRETNEENNTSRILIELTPATPPRNDNFNSAELLTGESTAAVGNNRFAGLEPGEPAHDVFAGNSIWYRWVAPSAGLTTITTEGSNFNTYLAVYTGSSLTSLTRLVGNDNTGNAAFSRVTFSAVAGRIYHIAVAGSFSASGEVHLSINPARNNHFTSAIEASGLSGTLHGSNLGATVEAGEPAHAGAIAGRSIWYAWTAPQTGPVTFDTIGSQFETVLAAYTGNSVAALTRVAENNDIPGKQISSITFDAAQGVTYRIAVDGESGFSGIVQLNWSQLNAPPQIVVQPVSTNVFTAGILNLTVFAQGTEPLSYLWQHQETNVVDNGNISGAITPNLSIHKTLPQHAGVYRVVITNAYGAVTSAPVHVIVRENARVVYHDDLFATAAGQVEIPLHIQALGDENFIELSVTFDPQYFSAPEVSPGPDAPGAIVLKDTRDANEGRVGVKTYLPKNATLEKGRKVFAVLHLTLAPNFPAGGQSFIGWGDSPTPRKIGPVFGNALEALYVPAEITFGNWSGFDAIAVEAGGQVRLTLNGVQEFTTVTDVSSDLQNWQVLKTNFFQRTEPFILLDPSATGQTNRFYRIRILSNTHSHSH